MSIKYREYIYISHFNGAYVIGARRQEEGSGNRSAVDGGGSSPREHVVHDIGSCSCFGEDGYLTTSTGGFDVEDVVDQVGSNQTP